jgi:hypothetical protein
MRKPGEFWITKVEGRVKITKADSVLLISKELYDNPDSRYMQVSDDFVIFSDEFGTRLTYEVGSYDYMQGAYWLKKVDDKWTKGFRADFRLREK